MAGERPITAMTLEHYPGMTEKKLAEIEAEAQARWSLQASLIVHRYGRMLPGEPIVLVATAAPHRAAALEACAFLIDWLKTEAPFWKLEESAGGQPLGRSPRHGRRRPRPAGEAERAPIGDWPRHRGAGPRDCSNSASDLARISQTRGCIGALDRR